MKCQRIFMATILVVLVQVVATIFATSVGADVVLYSNDFDGNVASAGGVTTSITGGTSSTGGLAGGLTFSQGYDGLSGFGGDFWRITTVDDVLEFSFGGLPTHDSISIAFSLAMMDSWDGINGTYGDDIINFAIFDGATQIGGISEPYFTSTAPSSNVESVIIQNRQLGFNTGTQPWWNDDGYAMQFDNLVASSGTLSIQFWASSGGTGSGFQGGKDESFAIDELLITYTVPEPTAFSIWMIGGLLCLARRQR